MSSMFGEGAGPAVPEPAARPGWARGVLVTAVILLVLFFAMSGFTSFWTEKLWFSSTGFSSVFDRLVLTKIGLFLAFGGIMAVAVAANVVLAYRLRPMFRPASPEQVGLDRYRQAVGPVRYWVLAGVALVTGAFAGTAGADSWRSYMLWRNGVPFGSKDPYFHRDKGFYVFDLPWLHHVVNFAMAVSVVSLLVVLVVHYLYGGIRLQATRDRLSGPAAAQISVLLGLFVLGKAADYWLDRYDLLSAGGGIVDGITYTDDHAVLPAKLILMSIAIICAVLFFANVVQRTWLLPSVGLALLVLSAILLGMVWPGVVQQFQVNPSASDKEPRYIARNIAATRDAYKIAGAKVTPYAGRSTLTPEDQRTELANVPGIRLVDPQLIQKAFENQQQLRKYFSVANVLDVDHYPVQGRDRDVVLGVREINQAGIPDDAKNWSNLHTVYTHGYGVIAAYGNQRDAEFHEQSLPDNPEWAGAGGSDSSSDLAPGGYRPQIYFGEKSPQYSIVGKASKGARDVELDQSAKGEEDTTSTYDGKAGVPIGSLFHQVLYAWKYGNATIALSERVNKNSKILYDRKPREMVEKVAPWLTVDSDPFPAIVDGKVVWMLDGYTTTDQYPLSERGSYKEMTSDSQASPTEFRTLPTDEINYMRNAVKATVDAYDGTVTLYAWDESDPILQAWRNAFPGTVKDKDQIPQDLLDHMRYPEDMFKVQRYQLQRYHVTDPDTFYEGKEQWEVPADPTVPSSPGVATKLQPPYRLSVRTGADSTKPVFSLTTTFVPKGNANLAAFMSVDGDASQKGYGTLRILELPSTGPVKGPKQVATDFATDSRIQNELTRFNASTNISKVYGNLLTLPVGDSLLYVQPLYTQKAGSDSSGNFPVLNYVLVSFGDRLAIATTMSEAVAEVLQVDGNAGSADGGDGGDGGKPGDGGGVLDDQVVTLLQQADREFGLAKDALKAGDLAKYQEHTDAAQRLVARALQASRTPAAAPATPSKQPSASSTPAPSAQPTKKG
ncbi:UPF0182 family membrane protein [Nocardioides jiangxiensis]|uniref:UPF0182 protein Q5722_03440 n=1 Tax=Nocardioides jiangxiensis TaxID=3064524 RepID=A0ABT9AY54_9ACTN|nr:UPF0182 family protein [Nocardioides sp. WY-20]MDO7867414.1 UPF0182 family protein [Nocardioides sp. WY-20]